MQEQTTLPPKPASISFLPLIKWPLMHFLRLIPSQLGTCERYQLAAFSHSREEEQWADELSRETFNIVAMNDSVFSPKIETLHVVA